MRCLNVPSMRSMAKELPEIDDEFAAEVSEFDTLDEYKADVKAKIKEQKADEGKRRKEDQAVEKAVANASMEIPDCDGGYPGPPDDG